MLKKIFSGVLLRTSIVGTSSLSTNSSLLERLVYEYLSLVLTVSSSLINAAFIFKNLKIVINISVISRYIEKQTLYTREILLYKFSKQ